MSSEREVWMEFFTAIGRTLYYRDRSGVLLNKQTYTK